MRYVKKKSKLSKSYRVRMFTGILITKNGLTRLIFFSKAQFNKYVGINIPTCGFSRLPVVQLLSVT